MKARRSEYDVSNKINTTDPTAVDGEVCRIFIRLYPDASPELLSQAFADCDRCYRGEWPGYYDCDTSYHNLQHVLDVTLAMARLWYAAYLTSQARYDDAVGEIRRAVELDPMSIRTHTFGTLYMMFTRRYDEAIELARRGLEFEPNSAFTLAFQGVAFAEQRRFTEAIGNLQRAVQLDKSPTIRALQAHVLAVAGQKAQAQELVRQLEDETRDRYFCPYEIGTVYVSLGNQDTATEWFRKGVKGRADCMAWLGIEPWLDPFRSDPRYKPLLRQIGLTPSER